MESNIWQEKIAGLPEFVQQQIADYIEFLVEKYSKSHNVLSETEKQILEERFAVYEKNGNKSADLNEIKIG